MQAMLVNTADIAMHSDESVPIITDIHPIDADYIYPSYEIQDNNILDIKSGVIIPKSVGSTTITVIAPDNSVSETVKVSIVDRQTVPTVSDTEVYNISNSEWGISNDGTNATATTAGINNALNYAKQNGYKKAIMEQGTYLIDETNPINMVGDLVFDLNGAILKLNPSLSNNIKMINIGEGANNCRITNGTIEGDCIYRKENSNEDEFVHGILINGCNNIELDNLNITNIQGYGIAVDKGIMKQITAVSKDNLTEISTNKWDSVDYIDISSINNSFVFCNPFGIGGWGYLEDTLYIDFTLYDENHNVIKTYSKVKPYREINKPSEAKYIKVALNDTIIKGSNSDYWNGVIFICEYDYTDYVNIHSNNINNCRCLGIAYGGGGLHNKIDNNIFENNGGLHASHDIDLEDSWEFMRNLVISNNTFNSVYGLVICAGSDIIVNNNTFNGTIDIDSRAQDTRIINNKINGHAVFKCEWYSRGVLLESNIFNEQTTEIWNTRNKEHIHRIYLKGNEFNGGLLVNNSTHEVISLAGITLSETTTVRGNFK